jgi:hypothetical protein
MHTMLPFLALFLAVFGSAFAAFVVGLARLAGNDAPGPRDEAPKLPAQSFIVLHPR